MKKTERLLLELFFKQKLEAPPTKKEKTEKKKDLFKALEDLVKIMRQLPEIKEDFDKAWKALEKKDDKPKGGLTLGQKYMMWTIAAVTLPPLYIVIIHTLFTLLKGG